MKTKYKRYLKLNLISLFFITVSFISLTLAWFAYSGLSTASMEIGVKAWAIDFQKKGVSVSNNIVISLSEIYPGMETVNEIVSIKNKGDSNAELKYNIESARILDVDYSESPEMTTAHIEDILSHDYPFHVNISLSKSHIVVGSEDSIFDVSISWPLDSDSDEQDSIWGSEAYEFSDKEKQQYEEDNTYQIRQPIKIVIKVTAEQYVESLTSSDTNYKMGDLIMYDVMDNRSCISASATCIKTHVINTKTSIGDSEIELLPVFDDMYNQSSQSDYKNATVPMFNEGHTLVTYTNYDGDVSAASNAWKVRTRKLKVDDLLKMVSTNVTDSFLMRDDKSPLIIGNLNYDGRMTKEIKRATDYDGYYSFKNQDFIYLSTGECYWTESDYDAENGFALVKIGDIRSKIYGENKISECRNIPIIIAPKSNITIVKNNISSATE